MDDFDVVMPDKNEEEFIDMAINLGYNEVVFLADDVNYRYKSSRIRLKTAYLLKEPMEFHRAKKNFDLIFARAERKFFEQHSDYIINAELSEKRDSFHYRNTSLNQVHAKLASQNSITIVFNFGMLSDSNSLSRIKYLGRMFQNAVLSKKYKLK